MVSFTIILWGGNIFWVISKLAWICKRLE